MSSDSFDLGPGDPTSCFKTEEGAPLRMIEFRGHDGRSLALPYAGLLGVEYRPTSGVVLEFPGHRVELRGRNLRPLYDALLEHRVRFVQESDLDVVPEADPFVDGIVVGPVEPEVG